MSNAMTVENFNALRGEFPGYSPAALFDVAAQRLGLAVTWETANWPTCSLWMDAFGNAPTSYVWQ